MKPAGEDSAMLGESQGEIEGGFSRRTLGWIIGSVAVSFVAAVLLEVYGPDLERRPRPDANTFSRSALGHRGLVEFLHAMGLGASPRQTPAGGGVGPQRPLVLAEPALAAMRPAAAVRMEELRQEAKGRGAPLVLVLPKWRAVAPRKDNPEWLGAVEPLRDDEILGVTAALADEALQRVPLRHASGRLHCTAAGQAAATFDVELGRAQLLEPSAGLVPMLDCPGAGVLIAQHPAGKSSPRTVVIADPDLLNNQGLGRAENAAAVYQLLTQGLAASGVVFDETIHGFQRTPGLLREALGFPLLLGVLQALLLLAMVLWAGMGRFGKPLPLTAGLAAGKAILIDNTAKLLANGGHAADSLSRYFRQTTRMVAAHFFLPPDLRDGERLARLQRITEARGGRRLRLAELEREIGRLSVGGRGDERAERIARRLHDWRVEMTNGDRESP